MAAELPNIDAPKDWWEPIRSNLFHAIDSPELLGRREKGTKVLVTYVSRLVSAYAIPCYLAEIFLLCRCKADCGTQKNVSS